MQDEVLILPEGSPNFMRTVRLATLYSEKLHVYLPTNQETIDDLSKYLALSDPARAFVPLSVAHRDEIELLRQENILTSITDDMLDNLPQVKIGLTELLSELDGVGDIGGEFKGFSPVPNTYRNEATKGQFAVCQILDWLLDFIIFINSIQPDERHSSVVASLESGSDLRNTVIFGAYFVLSSYYALQKGCVGMTWDESTREIFNKTCRLWTAGAENDSAEKTARATTKGQFGEYILQEEVLDLSRLHIEEILEVRRKRHAELKQFRDALRQFTRELDPELDPVERKRAFENIRDAEVRPALNELNAAIRALKIQTKNRSLSTSIQEVITFGLTVYVGQEFVSEIAAACIGVLGLVGKKVYDTTYGQKLATEQLVTKSPWAVCFDLNARSARN